MIADLWWLIDSLLSLIVLGAMGEPIGLVIDWGLSEQLWMVLLLLSPVFGWLFDARKGDTEGETVTILPEIEKRLGNGASRYSSAAKTFLRPAGEKPALTSFTCLREYFYNSC